MTTGLHEVSSFQIYREPLRPTEGAASFQHRSCDAKLSPIEQLRIGKRRRLVPLGPFVSSTYTSISATCSDECPHKSEGCYVQSGSTVTMARKQDAAARGHSATDVTVEEVALIDAAFSRGVPQDGARGGRDLRLHVGGDVGSPLGAELLAEAARRWRDRGGGTVWTYTHSWREIPRSSWGPAINILASVERAEDIELARQAGYPSAIVVARFPSTRAFRLPNSEAKIIPCPAETHIDLNKRVTCATCRLCLDRDLLGMGSGIGFEAHGPQARHVRENLAKLTGDGLIQIRRKGVDEIAASGAADEPHCYAASSPGREIFSSSPSAGAS
jgi:hypothetical protein